MSSENVKRVREWFDRWNAGDREFDDLVELLDPEFEIRSPFASLRGEPYRGIDGGRQWIQDVSDQFESWHYRIDEYRKLDDARVLALGEIHLRGRGSGIEIDQPGAFLLELRDGRFLRVTVWTSHEEALREVGLD